MPLVRLPDGTKKRFPYTPQGLFDAKEYAEEHDGEIVYEGKENKPRRPVGIYPDLAT
jgi:hypothetical protein